MVREKSLLPIKLDKGNYHIAAEDNKKLKDLLVDARYVEDLELKKEENEKGEVNSFQSFSDLELIYYFVQKERDTDEKKNRKNKTKKDYIRELLFFYKKVLDYEESIRMEMENYSESSLLKLLRRRHLKRFQEWLSSEPLGRNGKPYSVATLSKKTVIIKTFLKWIYNEDIVQEDLTKDLKSTNVSDNDRPNRDLSYEEVDQLLRYYETRNPVTHIILFILATTGLRCEELASAKWGDLYYDSFTDRYWLKVVGKNNKPREVVIFRKAFHLLVKLRKRKRMSSDLNPNDQSYLITTNKGNPYTGRYLSSYITRKIQETNLEFLKYRDTNITPHFMRHFFAIESAKLGVSIYDLQRTLDHESIKTTEIYLDKFMKKERNVALKWDESKF